MSDSDADLLQRYVRHGAEDAFAVLMARHLNLVYSAALRQVRSPQLAEEVAQSVFADLARTASRMKPDTLLTGWLYRVTRCTAIDLVRRESRRQARELAASQIAELETAEPDWRQIEPWLDEVMAELDEDERDAILLRFFQNKNLKQVGLELGVSEEAARKRVSRAVERLRVLFGKRRLAASAAGVGAILSTHAIQAAPVGLQQTILASLSVSGALIHGAGVVSGSTALVMTTVQKVVLTATLTAAVGAGVLEVHRSVSLRRENEALRLRQEPLAEQVTQLTQERDQAAAKVAAIQQELDLLRQEAPKLRGEVTRLRQAAKDTAQTPLGAAGRKAAPGGEEETVLHTLIVSAPEVTARLALLKHTLEQAPERRIPELQWLSDEDWVQAAAETQGDSETDVRKGLSILRSLAKNKVAPAFMQALHAFAEANQGELPKVVPELKPYFATPVDDAILDRYEIMHSGNIQLPDYDPYKPILREKTSACVDKLYDPFYMVSLRGFGSGGGSGVVFPKSGLTQTITTTTKTQ